MISIFEVSFRTRNDAFNSFAYEYQFGVLDIKVEGKISGCFLFRANATASSFSFKRISSLKLRLFIFTLK